MGVYFDANIMLGFRIDKSVFYKAFMGDVTIAEKSHLEDRFDPKTGKKLKPVKVIDQHEFTPIFYKGKEVFENELCRWIDNDYGVLRPII